jgi:hypothetical protein
VNNVMFAVAGLTLQVLFLMVPRAFGCSAASRWPRHPAQDLAGA